MVTKTDANCPCGSKNTYLQCCEPYLSGDKNPTTAEALMRSRYVAYTLNNNEYLLSTWHASTRPSENPVDEGLQWRGLEILSTSQGSENDEHGIVEFRAKCRVNNESAGLDESSKFVKEDDKWYYVDGGGIQPIRSRHNSIGRNEPCPCGSGKKFKKCCGP